MINKGFCSNDEVWKGLEQYPDGTELLWKNILYKLVSSDDALSKKTGKRSLVLEPLGKFVEPKRNEKCFCKSNKKYKKCCLKKWSRC